MIFLTHIFSLLGITAAKFLKKSGLKESLLHKIWSLSDYDTSGTLDKKGTAVLRVMNGVARKLKKHRGVTLYANTSS